jgi:hypothetical protein
MKPKQLFLVATGFFLLQITGCFYQGSSEIGESIEQETKSTQKQEESNSDDSDSNSNELQSDDIETSQEGESLLERLIEQAEKEDNNVNSNIPSQEDIERNQQDINELLQNIDELEQAADELIGDSAPQGEAIYEDLSGVDCQFLEQRALFYSDLAQDLSHQAERMTPNSSPQAATLEQAQVAAQRAQSFSGAYTEQCL